MVYKNKILSTLLILILLTHIQTSPFIIKLLEDIACITHALDEMNQKNREAVTTELKRMYSYYTNQPAPVQMHTWSHEEYVENMPEHMTFEDLAGDVPTEVYEIVEFLKYPEKFQQVGASMPKGILLVGPPGTGKTSIARAIAGEAQAAFFNASGSQFVEIYVGAGPKHIRELFDNARQALSTGTYTNAIIFIDEIDAIGGQRLDLGNSEYRNTLNELLNQMDGFEQDPRIIVIGATNTPGIIDSALKRPGRFDRIVTIGLPDELNRCKILEHYAKKITCDTSVDFTQIARKTACFSPAELKNLVNESAIRAARAHAPTVQEQHFKDALNLIKKSSLNY